MSRYNRDDYSACDWRVQKSDILRSKRAIAQRRRVRVSSVLGILLLVIVSLVTLNSIYESVKSTGETIKAGK